MSYTTDPIPAWIRQIRPGHISTPEQRQAVLRAQATAQLRRRMIEARKGISTRNLMRAPESGKA